MVDPVAEKHDAFVEQLRERLLKAIDPVMLDTAFPECNEAERGEIAAWALATLAVDVALIMGNPCDRVLTLLAELERYAGDVEAARMAERMTRHIGGGKA